MGGQQQGQRCQRIDTQDVRCLICGCHNNEQFFFQNGFYAQARIGARIHGHGECQPIRGNLGHEIAARGFDQFEFNQRTS